MSDYDFYERNPERLLEAVKARIERARIDALRSHAAVGGYSTAKEDYYRLKAKLMGFDT